MNHYDMLEMMLDPMMYTLIHMTEEDHDSNMVKLSEKALSILIDIKAEYENTKKGGAYE